jgi:hypothetical protein
MHEDIRIRMAGQAFLEWNDSTPQYEAASGHQFVDIISYTAAH